jgi:hypothetical protein
MLFVVVLCCSVNARGESANTFGLSAAENGNVFSHIPDVKETWSTGM